MLNLILVFISGLIFGFGLLLSDMVNPSKVLSFLDLAGSWDPSLAVVLVSAITVSWLGCQRAVKMEKTYLGLPISTPTKKQVETKLILGGTIFGIGWGLAGICPGPSIVLLGINPSKGISFIVAMLAGMFLYQFVEKLVKR